ncbi:Hypothetical predicted protein [Olea europaea subsp. europaea]|uniref:Uncharacterized protein n=1 Tax=Olea europaea subsp. europaea TaxID=158383 RepID=A0A8S0ST64_OLEEU|nr:Hypothetical predicted protein [Olea europaea subsp. europaea]
MEALIALRLCFLKGSWWNEKNDTIIRKTHYLIHKREFASEVCLFLNTRRYYLQQSLVQNQCLRASFGFF